jgi:hypothetical protein
MTKTSLELYIISETPFLNINRETVSDLNALNKYTASLTDANKVIGIKVVSILC